jgi:glycosyltransferase involved in cell wall biosynthesis
VRVRFVINTFTFGGSETDTIELVYGAEASRLQFTGIAVMIPLPLPDGEPPKDGTFPPIYTENSPHIDPCDPRVRTMPTFQDAVHAVIMQSDVIFTWGVHRLQEYLPDGPLPKIVVLSKDSGQWARGFLEPNSLVTRHYVGNSTLAARAFPERVWPRVEIVYNGISERRVIAKASRSETRRSWGFADSDKIAGYLGRIEADKGVDRTVNGIARLPEEWKAVFVGANPNCRYVRELEARCEALIPGRYRIEGWTHDVGGALAAFDVFSHPSDHEGFSNSIGEAWLAGIPTVYTRGTGAIIDVGDLGIGVSPNASGPEIAKGILAAYQNTQLAERARKAVRNRYLVSHNVARWTTYIESLFRGVSAARALAIFPDALAAQVADWIVLSCTACAGIDLVAMIAVEERAAVPMAMFGRLGRAYACPAWRFSHREDITVAIRYTRPDIIIAWGSRCLDHLLPPGAAIPVVDVFGISASGAANAGEHAFSYVHNEA